MLALFFKQYAPGQHDIAAPFVQLDDAHFEVFANQLVQIAHRSQIDLRARQKRLEADNDGQTTLDASHHRAFDHLVIVVFLADIIPDFDAIGLFLRQDDLALAIFFLFQQDIELFTDLQIPTPVREFIEINHTFGFVTDVDQHRVTSDLHYPAPYDFALLNVLQAFFVEPVKFFSSDFEIFGAHDALSNGNRFSGFIRGRGVCSRAHGNGVFAPARCRRYFNLANGLERRRFFRGLMIIHGCATS